MTTTTISADFLSQLTEAQAPLLKRAKRLTNYTNRAFNAEDLLSATNVKVLENADQYRADAPLLHWAYRIMSSVWFNYCNRQNALGIVYTNTDDETKEIVYEVAAPSDVIPALVEALIETASDTNREALYQHYILGKDYPEVASALGISQATARKRIERGLEQLRKAWN